MREGYIRKDKVEAAWYRFGAGLPMNLIKGNIPQISRAISFLSEPPPMRLIRTPKNGVAWTSQKRRKRNNEGLLQLVKDVRNNLLHGGKVPFRANKRFKLFRKRAGYPAGFRLSLGKTEYRNTPLNRIYEGFLSACELLTIPPDID